MATNWLGSAHEQVPSVARFIEVTVAIFPKVWPKVTNAYAQAPSFEKMATQMGIIDFHQSLPQVFAENFHFLRLCRFFSFRLMSHVRLCNDDQFIQLHLLESNFNGSAALRNLTFWDGHLQKLLTYTLVQGNRQGFVKLWRIPVNLSCLTGRWACEDKGEGGVW